MSLGAPASAFAEAVGSYASRPQGRSARGHACPRPFG